MPLAKECFEHIIEQEQFSKGYCHTWSQNKRIMGRGWRNKGKTDFFFLPFSITSLGLRGEKKKGKKKKGRGEQNLEHKLLQYPLGEAILQTEIVYCRNHRMNMGRKVLESDIKATYAQNVSSK